MYLLANWGMGDSELTARNSLHHHQQSTCVTSSVTQQYGSKAIDITHHSERLRHNVDDSSDDEVALHPLGNQVSF